MIEISKEYNLGLIYENPNEYTELLNFPGYLIYRIHNLVNDKNYIGDTKCNLKWRLFDHPFGAHFTAYEYDANVHLYNSMRKYGLDKFSISIVYQGEYQYQLEGEFIRKYDSFNQGYNRSLSGKGWPSVSSGRCVYYNPNTLRFIRIKESEIEYYLKLGYKPGFGKPLRSEPYKFIFNGREYRYVPQSKVQEYIDAGWHLQGRTSGYISVNNGTEEHKIPKDKLDFYKSKGYKEGILKPGTLGLIAIHKGTTNTFIDPTKLDAFIESGWEVGLCAKDTCNWSKGSKWMTNGNRDVRVSADKIDEYLLKGFKFGKASKPNTNKKGMNDGKHNYFIPSDQVDSYLKKGYVLGHLK